MNNRLDGQVALVTGASRGIGRGIALKLGEMGATVVGTATSEKGAADIQEYLDASGIKGWGAVLQVIEATSIDALLREIESRFGVLTILVNNAGITRDDLAMRMKDDAWDAVLDTNLKAVFRLCRAVMRPMMKARRGRIINITSVVASSGNPGQANYCAAKAGVEGMSRALAKELGARNITVNCVAPGFIETDMTGGIPEEVRKALLSITALGRAGRPEDVAASVAFLASPEAAYITGTTLHVNGGMYM